MAKTYRFGSIEHADVLQKEISYFLALAEALNISKAAENLGIQQSGLSRALQRMEREFGQKFFQRKNNGLVLTPSGEKFLVAVKKTKQAWEEAFQDVLQSSEEPSGLLKIGFHPSFGQKYFPSIVKAFTEIYPSMEIEAHTLSSNQVTRKVNDQELDIGLVISPIKNPEIIQKKIGVDYMAVFQRDISLKPTKIIFNPDMRLSMNILRKHSQTKKVIIKDYEIIAETCKKTDCMGILPKSVAGKYPELVQVGGAYLKTDISCIAHKERMLSSVHKKIFNLTLKACLSP